MVTKVYNMRRLVIFDGPRGPPHMINRNFGFYLRIRYYQNSH